MDLPGAIRAVTERRDLNRAEMRDVMRTIMTGQATQAQIGGFLIGLRMKGETVDEIAAAAEVMRELAEKVDVKDTHLVDTCGTGGDGAHTFNISTCCAFVVAAAGAKVAKHGNRSISSRSGSADLLEAAGIKIDLDSKQVARCINEVGVGFMFAPKHHGAMKHAIGPRREMGVRTIFNVLGPLTNPANAQNQVIGVFSRDLVKPLAEVLKHLGSRHVMVVHAEDGMDEISIGAPSHVAELKNGHIDVYSIMPEDFGFKRTKASVLSVDSAEQSLQIVKNVLGNQSGPARDIVALNAGAAIYVAGITHTYKEGIAKALAVIESGEAMRKLERLVELSNQC